MTEQQAGIDTFLDLIHELEKEVSRLIHKSNLTSQEKSFILEHILVVPGKKDIQIEPT